MSYFMTLMVANVVLILTIAILVLCNASMAVSVTVGVVVTLVIAGIAICKTNKYIAKKLPYIKDDGDTNGHS